MTPMPLPGGVLRLGGDGTILAAPRFFAEAMQLDRRDAPSIFHLFDPARSRHLSLARVFFRPEQAVEYHLEMHGDTSELKGLRYWQLPQPEAGGAQVMDFFIVDDTSVWQSREWAVRRLRRDILADVQTSLASGLRNQLSSMAALLEVVRTSPHDLDEACARLTGALEQTSSLVDQILGQPDMGGPEGAASKPDMQLSHVLVTIPSWSERGVAIEAKRIDATADCRIPEWVLDRVLLPLLTNALEASEPGTRVRVLVGSLDDGQISWVIEDDGQGMTPEVLARAEDPFFTTRVGHLGMGLAQVRETLRQQGGDMTMESVPGRGTRVQVLLPLGMPETLLFI